MSEGEKTVAVNLGGLQGSIDIADMDRARKPNPEIAYHAKMIKQLATAHPGGGAYL